MNSEDKLKIACIDLFISATDARARRMACIALDRLCGKVPLVMKSLEWDIVAAKSPVTRSQEEARVEIAIPSKPHKRKEERRPEDVAAYRQKAAKKPAHPLERIKIKCRHCGSGTAIKGEPCRRCGKRSRTPYGGRR